MSAAPPPRIARGVRRAGAPARVSGDALEVPAAGRKRLPMTNHATHTSPHAAGSTLDIDAALADCGPGFDELRERVLACRRRARRDLDARLERALSSRGIESERACAIELTASLDDFSVCELLQVIAQGRKDAVIDVVFGELSGRMWCSEGEVVDAVSGRLKGEAAAYRIVALAQGEVVVDVRPVRHARAVTVSTQALLMEALRRKDEGAVLESRLGGPDCIYRSAPGVAPRADLRGLERALLDALDAGARLGSVLACSSVDDLTVLQAMAELVERGWLVPVSDASRSARIPRDGVLDVPAAGGARRPLRARTMAWVAGVTVLSIGTALAVARWRSSALPPPRAEVASLSAATPGRAGSAPAPQAGLEGESAPYIYPLQLVVNPSSAEIWLDGHRVATGELSMVLARDGRAHELRISAPEHVPLVLLFRDVPPPRAVVLAPRAPATGAGS
jgi:hypothetical protein